MKNYETYRYTNQRTALLFEEFRPPIKLKACLGTGINDNAPLISDELIFLAFGMNRVSAFNELDHSLRWEINTRDFENEVSSPIGIHIVDSHLIFNINDILFCVEKTTGTIVSKHHLGRVGSLNFVNFPDYRNVFCPIVDPDSMTNYIWLEEQDFRTLHRDSRNLRETAAVTDRLVAVTQNRRSLICVNAATFADLWVVETSSISNITATDEKDHFSGKITGGILIHDGLVLFGIEEFHVFAVDLETGMTLWASKTGVRNCDRLGIGPDGNIHLLDSHSYASLDPKTGRIVREKEFGTKLLDMGISGGFSHFSFSNSHILLSDGRGCHIIAFNLSSLEIDWTYTCKAPLPIHRPPILVNGRLYTVDLNGELYLFESENLQQS